MSRCSGTWFDLVSAPVPVERPCERPTVRGEQMCAECLRQQRRLAELQLQAAPPQAPATNREAAERGA